MISIKKKRLKRTLFILLFLLAAFVRAQDAQYSQFYANALYLSPAFAGSNQTSRAILHSRLQWPGIDATYISSTFSIDHYFSRFKSGLGLLVNTDYLNAYSARTFRNLDIGLQYAYQIELSEAWTLRPGLQLSFAQKSFNSGNLTWVRQYDNRGFQGGFTGEEDNISTAPIYYPDVSTGGLLYSKNIWVGIAAHHLNRPSQSFLSDGSNRLNIRTTLHAGIKIPLGEPVRKRYGYDDSEIEKSVSPVMVYKMQGKYDQLDLGLYFRYNYFVFGSTYRGIPLKVYKSEKMNNDAIVLLAGVVYRGLNIGYSYDFTISKLASPYSGGSHELSITYNFLVEISSAKRKPPVRQRKPYCPAF
jgi:type IX secretion system PorP/SprF family membrane protein